MRRQAIRIIILAVLAAVLPRPGRAQSWKLMGRADLMAGQYFFQKTAGSVNGYTDVDLQVARSISSKSGFYVSGRSMYTGFKQVNELAGGGTLFQQSMDNSLGFKWMERFADGWSLKPRAGVRNQLFRETKDESWGNGLYDLWRYEAGAALERKTRWGMSVPWTYQFSYDLYYTRYQRFKTLASKYGAEISAPNPGSRTLDTVSHQLAYRSDWDLPGFTSAYLFYSLSMINFVDQKVVNSRGEYLNAKRSDIYQSLSLGGSKRLLDMQALGRVRPVLGMGVSFSDLISNQNHLDTDPARMKFVGAYYDYWEFHLSPNASVTFLKPMLTLRSGYDFAARFYTGRVSQNSDGAYTGTKLTQKTHGVFLEAAYPIWGGLDLKARGQWSRSLANTGYEQTYNYNYYDYNYFAGIEWKL